MSSSSDSVMALQIILIAAGYKPKPQKPLNPLAQELLDYVNSPEYNKLILKEWDERKQESIK